MARPYWSGQIQISLVSFGVKLFVATEAASDIHFHQIDRKTGERVRHQKVLASAIERAPEAAAEQSEVVGQSAIVKGYEYAKGQYVTIEPEELAHLRVPSKHTMEVMQFVEAETIPFEFFEKPYFVVPENDAQTEAFLTVRKALLETKKLAITKVAFAGREHVAALAPAGTDAHGGFMLYTLRYEAELRDDADYFRDIKKMAIAEDSLDLAKELIKRKASAFEPKAFVDGYEAAVKELVEAKLQHAPIPRDETPAKTSGKVINLMDALKRSIDDGEAGKKTQPVKEAAASKENRRKVTTPVESRKGPVLVKMAAKKPAAARKPKTAAHRKSA